jgi:hypothetical protein
MLHCLGKPIMLWMMVPSTVTKYQYNFWHKGLGPCRGIRASTCWGEWQGAASSSSWILDHPCALVYIQCKLLVLLLGIFRRASHPAATRGCPCAFSLPRGHPNCLLIYLFKIFIGNLWYQLHQKLMGKHFIDPKRSEIPSVFQVFPCTTQIYLF